MIRKEVAEIRKQFTHDNCSITKVSGCYVDGEKNIKTKFTESFLTLAEEETFKYFEIFKKTLSGRLGKNLINMEFPLEEEFNEGKQEFLLKLRDSGLKDDDLLDEFYNKIIESYDYVGNYLILIINAVYDIPGKGQDNLGLDDASEEVYNYILASICPVKLSKAGLSYNADTNMIQTRIQDWVVGVPDHGFLFPAFINRSADIHNLLYYSRKADIQEDLIIEMFGCDLPLSAEGQKEIFTSLIAETLGEECNYEIIRNIHDGVSEFIEENKDHPEPKTLEKEEIKYILKESGVGEEKLENIDKSYEKIGEKNVSLDPNNIINTRSFELKTPDVVIKVHPERTNLVETRMVDGQKCIVIPISDQVEVNGIPIH